MLTHTVGRLARRFGLSRSTLLYYDSIGLLSPTARARGEYRQYGPEEVRRLERICTLRRAGMGLKDIRWVLEGTPHTVPDDGFADEGLAGDGIPKGVSAPDDLAPDGLAPESMAEDRLAKALERRVVELDREMAVLREQQQVVVKLLQSRPESRVPLDRVVWTELLRRSGFDDDDMHRWHRTFERTNPEGHERFLRFLGMDDAEIERIREWSAARNRKGDATP